MGLASLLVLSLAPQLIAALTVQARQSVTCEFAAAANSGDTCSSFASYWGQTETAFQALNPGISCPNLVAGQNYCAIGTVTTATTTPVSAPAKTVTHTTSSSSTTTLPTTTKSTTATSATTKSATTTSPSLPEPTQSGLAANCNSFHLVVSGDTCAPIESHYGITAAQFSSWNPSIDSTCDNLWLGYYVCVGVTGIKATTTTPTPTPTPTVASSPSPLMPGVVSNCKKYYKVQSGDACYAVEQAEKITSAEFLAWNTYLDANCDNLWLGYYVCVGV